MYIKSIIYSLVLFTLAPLTIVVSLLSLSSFNPVPTVSANKPAVLAAQVFASLPTDLAEISTSIQSSDAREEIIRQYLNKYNSPLAPHAHVLVAEADKNKLDFRLLTAIAQQESNLCKKIPEDTYNCWGWGIHSRGTLGFSSFEEGIAIVSQGLKEKYLDKGYTTPDEIMKKYTPSSPGSWAYGVNTFMGHME